METAFLDVENLGVTYRAGDRSVVAVGGVDIRIGQGESVGIVGESGSGKSTFARAIMDLLPASAQPAITGTIRLDGKDVKIADLHRVRGRDFAMVFQDPLSYLDPLMRVGDQIAEVVHVHDRKAGRDRVGELLEMVQLQRTHARFYPHELSGGMRQRVMIAMALACKARLLIADEPTTALDVTTQKEILLLIARLRRDLGMSLLLISHDLGVVSEMCERVYVMLRGKVIESGPVRDVFRTPRHDYTRALIAAGSDQAKPLPVPVHDNGPILTLRGVGKTFGSGASAFRVLDGIDLDLHQGETVALVGESGSGKSTLARVILSLIAPDQGDVTLNGQVLNKLPAAALQKARSAMYPVFQDSSEAFNPRRNIRGILSQALDVAGVPARDAAMTALLEQVQLRPGQPYLDRFAHELSGGQRQRLAIARALATGAEVIVADEPLSGADLSIRALVVDLLRQLQADRSLAYIFITHDIWLAHSFAHRIAVMYKGRIVEEGPADAIIRHPKHDYTRKLVAAAPVLKL